MTETLLALIPTYGPWLIALCVLLSCLALPVPSSMMVMVAGGFAAAGDFGYWQLVAFAFAGFLAGDQAAFWLARGAGGPLIARLRERPRTAPAILRAERLVTEKGLVAVFLSRTILSPVGPWVGYASGALRLDWPAFTAVAASGAFLWCLGYSWLGYAFADDIAGIAALIGRSVGIVLAGCAAVGGLWFLVGRFRQAGGPA